MVGFELGYEIEKDVFFVFSTQRGTEKKFWVHMRNLKVWGLIPQGDSEFFLFPHTYGKTETSFSKIIFLYHLKPQAWGQFEKQVQIYM